MHLIADGVLQYDCAALVAELRPTARQHHKAGCTSRHLYTTQGFGLVVLVDKAPVGQVHRRCGRVADYHDFFAGIVTFGVDQGSFDIHYRMRHACRTATASIRSKRATRWDWFSL